MSDTVVQVENLTKRYRLGSRDETSDTFMGAMASVVRSPLRNFKRLRSLTRFTSDEQDADDVLYALRDVSFNIKRGEVVGIIGRNGAGKSTLLKILSRICSPTSGRVRMCGRVSALLEVGTGFHPELTGRENVFLNGTILGMRKREIDAKFDQIVEFSGVEKFLDTPVKRYSSGMKVRLAFSVAAHLEPEVLIVDEVLAVGDAEFQAKCLGKMQDVASGEGRTILFVSHNMAAVQQLCQRAILLRDGRLTYDGTPEQAVQEHLSHMDLQSMGSLEDREDRKGNGLVRLQSLRILNAEGEPGASFVSGQPIGFEFACVRRPEAKDINIAFTIYNATGVACSHVSTRFTGHKVNGDQPETRAICWLDKAPLPPGQYRISASVTSGGEMADLVPSCARFHVDSSVFFPFQVPVNTKYCPVFFDHRWEQLPCR